MDSARHARAAAGKPVDSTQAYREVYDGQTGACNFAWSQPGDTACCPLCCYQQEAFPKLSLQILLLCPSVMSDSLRPHGLAACQASLSINSQDLLKLMSIESVIPSTHLILCRPLLLPPSIFASIRVFSNESVLRIRQPKYWSLSFSISPSNVYSGLISLTIDWLDLLAVQGTLKSLLQHHSSKASILRCSAHSPSFISIHDH